MTARRRRLVLDGLASQIALTALGVALVAIATLAVGVLVIGSYVFATLMASHGESAAVTREMWEHSVVPVFVVATGVAAALSTVLGILLARRVSRPLARLGAAARRLAEGDYAARAPRHGPHELASVADSFNQMAETLEAQERQRAELVANFAHELRTPLTNLRGYLEAMRDGIMAPSAEVFDSLREEVERLERLSRSLDALGGDVTGKAPPVELDLAAAVHAAAELARPGFERAGVRLEVELPPTRLWARAVPDHLSQVLTNLLQNAQRYTAAGGMVTVAAAAERGDVLVTVGNVGADIPDSDLPHLFERFYRVDKSRDRARGGAGIGLAIVKQLVEQAGGRVGAESVQGTTRFWFRLPSTAQGRKVSPADPLPG